MADYKTNLDEKRVNLWFAGREVILPEVKIEDNLQFPKSVNQVWLIFNMINVIFTPGESGTKDLFFEARASVVSTPDVYYDGSSFRSLEFAVDGSSYGGSDDAPSRFDKGSAARLIKCSTFAKTEGDDFTQAWTSNSDPFCCNAKESGMLQPI